MTAIYVLLALLIIIASAATVLGVVALKRRGSNASGVTADDIRDENYRLLDAIDKTVSMKNSMLVGSINAQNETGKQLNKQFIDFMLNIDAKMDRLKEDISRSLNEVRKFTTDSMNEVKNSTAASLKEVREENGRQLEKMRETVDEKLSSTLEQRFTQSFKMVNERLEEINRTFGELQNLQSGVRDLNNIFKNVKTRGTWGEISLDSLLSQILAPTQYEKQARLSKNAGDTVDFVIKMPGKGDGEVLLPIDAKFPIEDYERLMEASRNADAGGVEAAGKALAQRIKQEAMSIRDKYIKPPKTTDFAIMYLPTEGLFAEIIKRDGLMETLQTQYRVVVCGPTTIAALLNSLQMGFKSVAIEKRSTEIGRLLAGFVKDFGKFSALLQQTGVKLQQVQNTISEAGKRTEIIQKKLDKVKTFEDENDALEESDDFLMELSAASYEDD